MIRAKLIVDVIRTLKTRGVRNTLNIVAGQLKDILFDVRHGTDTVVWQPLQSLDIASPNRERGNLYQATTTAALERIFGDVQPMLPEKSAFLDVGSGKGKVLLVASEYGFTAVRGVEFSGQLCEITRKNADRYFRKRTEKPLIEIIEMDAVKYRIQPDENLFFLFNPFDAVIFGISDWPITFPHLLANNIPHPGEWNRVSQLSRVCQWA